MEYAQAAIESGANLAFWWLLCKNTVQSEKSIALQGCGRTKESP
jgi:hypothetical protein